MHLLNVVHNQRSDQDQQQRKNCRDGDDHCQVLLHERDGAVIAIVAANRNRQRLLAASRCPN